MAGCHNSDKIGLYYLKTKDENPKNLNKISKLISLLSFEISNSSQPKQNLHVTIHVQINCPFECPSEIAILPA